MVVYTYYNKNEIFRFCILCVTNRPKLIYFEIKNFITENLSKTLQCIVQRKCFRPSIKYFQSTVRNPSKTFLKLYFNLQCVFFLSD